MAALLESKAFFSSNGKVLACQFSLNEDSSLRLNSFALLVEVSPSLKAPRPTLSPPISISFTVRHQNSNGSKNTLASSGSGVGGFRMDQRRRVRLESVVVWEQKVQAILAYFRYFFIRYFF